MRLTAIIAALGLCAVLAVTASAQNSPPTKQSGKLIVGFDLPAPGFWNGRASGSTIKNPSGFEYSLALAIAKQLRIGPANVQFVRAPFGTILLPGKKKFDFALEETTITAQRAKVIGFSTPYFDANQGVLVSKGTSVKHDLRPAVAPDVRAGRDDRPRLHPAQAAPDEEAARLLGVVERRVRRGRGEAVPGADPRRADRRLPEQEEAGSVRRRRRADPHRRGLRGGHGEGLGAEAVASIARSRRSRRTGRSRSCRRSGCRSPASRF